MQPAYQSAQQLPSAGLIHQPTPTTAGFNGQHAFQPSAHPHAPSGFTVPLMHTPMQPQQHASHLQQQIFLQPVPVNGTTQQFMGLTLVPQAHAEEYIPPHQVGLADQPALQAMVGFPNYSLAPSGTLDSFPTAQAFSGQPALHQAPPPPTVKYTHSAYPTNTATPTEKGAAPMFEAYRPPSPWGHFTLVPTSAVTSSPSSENPPSPSTVDTKITTSSASKSDGSTAGDLSTPCRHFLSGKCNRHRCRFSHAVSATVEVSHSPSDSSH